VRMRDGKIVSDTLNPIRPSSDKKVSA